MNGSVTIVGRAFICPMSDTGITSCDLMSDYIFTFTFHPLINKNDLFL